MSLVTFSRIELSFLSSPLQAPSPENALGLDNITLSFADVQAGSKLSACFLSPLNRIPNSIPQFHEFIGHCDTLFSTETNRLNPIVSVSTSPEYLFGMVTMVNQHLIQQDWISLAIEECDGGDPQLGRVHSLRNLRFEDELLPQTTHYLASLRTSGLV